ncbi:associated with histones/Spt16/Pob3 [Scheffersomyces xylosifermentans]|uniref:associated with histones/Spt16/Pob3 n=1 Tax=Scheffersomyces xylosifermentans TaxID=1304137 RepID=UPI00315C6A52
MGEIEEGQKVWSAIDHDITSNLLSKITNSIECSICAELMHVPLTAECGHSFCYDCLFTWFQNKMNCPTCRHEITIKPSLNLHLKDISKSIVDIIIDTTLESEEKKKLEEYRNGCWKSYNFDSQHDRIFGDLFKTALTLIDNSDGVPRCGNCHWEAHGTVCLHCGTRFRIPHDDEYYDSADGAYNEEYEEQFHNSQDEYDSADSFVDPRDEEEINRDLRHAADDDILSTDNEDEAHEEWHGFGQVDLDHVGDENSPIEISADEDDDDGLEYYDSDDIRDALDEFHDAQLAQEDDSDDGSIVVRRHRVGFVPSRIVAKLLLTADVMLTWRIISGTFQQLARFNL